jgi:hypothetical protein
MTVSSPDCHVTILTGRPGPGASAQNRAEGKLRAHASGDGEERLLPFKAILSPTAAATA